LSSADFRSAVLVTLSVPGAIYERLPPSFLKRGINVIPVVFNIGINEQATLAEKYVSVFDNCSEAVCVICFSVNEIYNESKDI